MIVLDFGRFDVNLSVSCERVPNVTVDDLKVGFTLLVHHSA